MYFEKKNKDVFENIIDNFKDIKNIYKTFMNNDGLKYGKIQHFYHIVKNIDKMDEFNVESMSLVYNIFDSDYVILYIFLLMNPSYFDISEYKFLKNILNKMSVLKGENKQLIINELKKMNRDIFLDLVFKIQQYISISCSLNKSINSSIITLDLFYKSNLESKLIEHKYFYNDIINKFLNFDNEVLYWINDSQSIFNFSKYPYLLNPSSKNKLLNIELNRQSRVHFYDLLIGVNPFLNIKIRRDNILFDTIQQLQNKSSSQLKKKLKVEFVDECAVDEGGVRREFFQLITEELLNEKYGIFIYDNNTRTYWFNLATLESNMTYELIGKIIGIAIYNKIILNIHFPKIIYKKLLNEDILFNDFVNTFPQIGSNLIKLLEYEGNVEDLCLDFSIIEEHFDIDEIIELKENGKNINVTNENRDEYVKLYVDYKINTSIKDKFNFFKEGFYKLCDGTVLNKLNSDELELIICGNPILDFYSLEKTTLYADGYEDDMQIIKDFWNIVHKLTIENKKKLLFFVTGSDRVPIEGLSELKITITRNGPDTNRLPTSQTCFNQLLLPEYSDKNKLEKKLMIAINNSKGFGLR